MQYLKIKDFKIRQKILNLEKRRIINNFAFTNAIQKESLTTSQYSFIIFKHLKKRSKNLRVYNRLTRRCIITNRNRGSFQKIKISRILLRDMLGFGIVPGYKKAVW